MKSPENPYMMIRNGVKVFLRDPKSWVFEPYDTAVSLSYINRFAGNCGEYSVAQHAVNVANTVQRLTNNRWDRDANRKSFYQLELAGLHHDDPEMVIGDIPNPMKRMLGEAFWDVENRLEAAVECRYGLTKGLIGHQVVKEADLLCFLAEVRVLCPEVSWGEYEADVGTNLDWKKDLQPTWQDVMPWTRTDAVARYMDTHESLMDMLNEC